MADKGMAGVGGALQALNSFMIGFAGEKHRRAQREAERKRVKQLEDRTGIMQQQADWMKEDRDRRKLVQEETHKGLARAIAKLGVLKTMDVDPKTARAEIMLDSFNLVRDNPNVDMGTVSTFITGAADFLFPKKDVKTSVVQHISKSDGLMHTYLINMETGAEVADLGQVEKGVTGVSGTNLQPGDFNKWYSDMWGAYLKEYNQELENMISSGKFLHGSVLLSDMSMDAITREQKQRESYAAMRKGVLEEVGTFRDYLARFSVGLVGKPKDFEKFLDAVAPKLPDKPMVTFEQYRDRLDAIINAQGWTPETLDMLRQTVSETRKAVPMEGENLEAALRAILEDRGEPKAVTSAPWIDLDAGTVNVMRSLRDYFRSPRQEELIKSRYPGVLQTPREPGSWQGSRTPQEYMDWFRKEYPEHAR